MQLSEKQIQIIHVTSELLLEKGAKGLTIKVIAKKMNFSEGALYRHFKNKDEIIIKMINYFAQDVHNRLDKIYQTPLSASNMLHEFIIHQTAFVNHHKSFFATIFSDTFFHSKCEKEIKQSILECMGGIKQRINLIFKKGVQEGDFSTLIPAENLTHFLMGAMKLNMMQWRLNDFKNDIQQEGLKTLSNYLKLISNK